MHDLVPNMGSGCERGTLLSMRSLSLVRRASGRQRIALPYHVILLTGMPAVQDHPPSPKTTSSLPRHPSKGFPGQYFVQAPLPLASPHSWRPTACLNALRKLWYRRVKDRSPRRLEKGSAGHQANPPVKSAQLAFSSTASFFGWVKSPSGTVRPARELVGAVLEFWRSGRVVGAAGGAASGQGDAAAARAHQAGIWLNQAFLPG